MTFVAASRILCSCVQEYGLKASKLNPQKIASQLGFKKKSGKCYIDGFSRSMYSLIELDTVTLCVIVGHVGIVNRRVTSKYGDNLFTRYSGQGEDIYQVYED